MIYAHIMILWVMYEGRCCISKHIHLEEDRNFLLEIFDFCLGMKLLKTLTGDKGDSNSSDALSDQVSSLVIASIEGMIIIERYSAKDEYLAYRPCWGTMWYGMHRLIVIYDLMSQIIDYYTSFDRLLSSILDVVLGQDHLPSCYSSKESKFIE